jgi:superfamily II DNA or RNA helicase
MKGKIKSVEYIDDVDYVYDISVEDNHNFIANGVVVSNCHHIPANTVSEVSRYCKNAYYRIGVSATPWRDAGDDLLIEATLAKRKPENNINASKLIQLGYLVPCSIYFVPIKEVFKGKNYHKLYNDAIVNNKVRNEAIIKIAKKMKETKDMTTLILIQRIEHGEALMAELVKQFPKSANIITVEDDKTGKQVAIRVKNIEFLSGKDDAIRRKAVIQAAKEKKVDILIGSTIADEGLDIPSLDCLILAGGGKSSTRAFQRVGRVLRLYPGKERAIIFDFEDHTPTLLRHAKVRKKLYLQEPEWEIKYLNPSMLK